jgi:lactam utilization protein B
VITAPENVANHALRLIEEGIAIKGEKIRMDTLCLHSDNSHAVDNARAVRHLLEAVEIEVGPL